MHRANLLEPVSYNKIPHLFSPLERVERKEALSTPSTKLLICKMKNCSQIANNLGNWQQRFFFFFFFPPLCRKEAVGFL